MHFLTILDGAFAWLSQNGVYRQAQLYARGEAVYAKVGSGYVRLRAQYATSSPTIRWREFDAGEQHVIGFDRLKDPILIMAQPVGMAAE